MNKILKPLATACVALLLASCGGTLPYQDPSLSPDERATDLIGRLTLEEKVSLMQFASPAIPRLDIKEYNWWNEALHGVGRSGLATVFPQCVGMAASWDDALVQDVFTAVSDEARAKSNEYAKSGGLKIYQGLTFWTPNVNIFRDPRWGRGQETYGEDPYLTARMGVNVVRGLQGPEGSKYDKLHACAKHFAVHSGPEWNRHIFNAENITPRDLWETYLPAFKALVQEANVKEVMCAYNRYEGEPCCGSNRLLQQILRDEWGFQGLVVSDCWAISDFYTPGRHHTEPDSAHASAKAVVSGTDLECGESYRSLVEAVGEGLISESRLDTALHRVLKARFELGEFDKDVPWHQIPLSVVDSKKHRELALRMAQESIVLLQNRNNILPLKKEDLKIALVGPNANDSIMQWGNYNGFPSHTVTLLQALQEQLPTDQLIYEHGCDHTSAVALQSLFNECTASDGQKGFKASYWKDLNHTEGKPDVVTHVSNPFRFTTAGAIVFAPGVPLGGFLGVYETTFKPTTSEDVVFSFHTQGGAQLYINGQQVASVLNMKSNRVHVLKAEAGKSYDIKVTFAATEGDCATLNFDFGREVPLDLRRSVDRVKDADVVIFAGGISPGLEGEEMPVTIPGFRGGDRERIELPTVQTELLKELRKAGKKIVFVNFSGSAMALTQESKLCDAIVQAWYPGQAGGTAIASVLFGDYNPAGRLPVTFYKSTEQLPDFQDYNMKGHTYRYMTEKPLFPFGHGLSYTTFDYGQASLSANEVKCGETCTLTIPVTNTGKRDGEEVVQVYLRRPDDKEGPGHTLRAFRRILLKKGETQQVTFQLDGNSFEWFDTESNTMRPLKGDYIILYGGTSDTSKLQRIPIKLI